MQTILGANGTIGSVLAKELANYTSNIRLVSRNPKKVNESDEIFSADLSDPVQVEKAIAGSEVVYLLVGFDYNLKVWRGQWPKLMKATIEACIKHNAKLVFGKPSSAQAGRGFHQKVVLISEMIDLNSGNAEIWSKSGSCGRIRIFFSVLA